MNRKFNIKILDVIESSAAWWVQVVMTHLRGVNLNFYASFWMSCTPHLHVFALWKESGISGGNPTLPRGEHANTTSKTQNHRAGKERGSFCFWFSSLPEDNAFFYHSMSTNPNLFGLLFLVMSHKSFVFSLICYSLSTERKAIFFAFKRLRWKIVRSCTVICNLKRWGGSTLFNVFNITGCVNKNCIRVCWLKFLFC